MAYGILFLRVIVGVLLFLHGTQKLFGWWGGPGPRGAAGFFGSLGFSPPLAMAIVAGMSEASGLLFALPLGVPGLIAGPIAYFLGKGSKQRIAESNGALGGTSFANAGRILGIVATAVGAVVTLIYLILLFNAMLDAPAESNF